VKPGIDKNFSTYVPRLQLFGSFFFWLLHIFYLVYILYIYIIYISFDAQQTNMPRLQVEPEKNMGSSAWSLVNKIAGIYGGSSPKYRISLGCHRFSSIAEEYVLDCWHSF
jgi:hypothetical protein